MFKNNLVAALLFIPILVGCVVFTLYSCDPNGFPTWWDVVDHQDPAPAVTCGPQDLHEINQPQFISGWIQFDNDPVNLEWHVGPYQGPDLVGMIQALNPNTVVTFYQSDKEVAVVIDGTDDKTWIENKVYARTDNNPKTFMVFTRRSLYLGSAASFQDWITILDSHPSNSGLNMRNGLTQAQKDSLWENNLDYDSCKIAPTLAPLQDRIDFRFDSPSQVIRDRYKERGWHVIE